nr:PKD domain-containing protein [Candidatus Sigynarchaeota archaeon]
IDYITVFSDQMPYADFVVNATIICENDFVQFLFIGDEGDDPAIFVWNFGDGSPSSTARDPIHQYNTSGWYSVSLFVVDADGDSDYLQVESCILVIDVQAPAVVVSPGALVCVMEGTPSVPLTWMLTDTSGKGMYTILLDGNALIVNQSWLNGIPFHVDVNASYARMVNYTVLFEDDFGNRGRATTLVIVDDVPRLLLSPTSITTYRNATRSWFHWMIADEYRSGGGWYMLTRNNVILVKNASWVSNELISILISLDLEPGAYNYTLYYYDDYGHGGSTTFTVTVIETPIGRFISFVSDNVHVIVIICVVGLAIIASAASVSRKKKLSEKKYKTPNNLQPGKINPVKYTEPPSAIGLFKHSIDVIKEQQDIDNETRGTTIDVKKPNCACPSCKGVFFIPQTDLAGQPACITCKEPLLRLLRCSSCGSMLGFTQTEFQNKKGTVVKCPSCGRNATLVE